MLQNTENLMQSASIRLSDEWNTGFEKLRAQSSEDSKLGISSFLRESKITFYEVRKLAEKMKWSNAFRGAYDGGCRPFSQKSYGSDKCKMFVLMIDKKKCGFIRIVNKSHLFQSIYDGEVWSISEIYVKPPYRSQGVSAQLIHYVLKNYPVKSIVLSPERYKNNQYYFNRFGFNVKIITDDYLYQVYLSQFKNIVLKRLAILCPSEHVNEKWLDRQNQMIMQGVPRGIKLPVVRHQLPSINY